jgi:excisionase family DNA binding protein
MGDEILTAAELSALLKISKGQIYELAKKNTRNNPLPVLRIGSSVRFRRNEVETWLSQLAAENKAA